MKNSKKLKLIFEILICILIILVGIVGIYTKDGNMYKDLLPNYTLGSDINGITVLEFEVDNSVNTIYYDKEGNEVDSSKITEENKKEYTTKEIPVNAEENLIKENYQEAMTIMEKRLKLLGADQYKLDLDEASGKILLSVEDDYIEDVESFLPMESRLKLIDSNTEDVIIDYTDFKTAQSTYASLTTEYRTYINLKLNDSGIEKSKNIDKYKTIVQTEDGEEESKILVMFDTEKIAEVPYNQILLNGKTLRVTTATGLTSDSAINSQINMDTIACKLSTIGKLPVLYNLTAEEFVKTDMAFNISNIVIGIIAICVIASMFLIIKYKSNGLLSTIGFVTNISIFLIVMRLTKVQISLNGFAGILGLILLNTLLVNNILKCIKERENKFSENVKKGYLNTLNAIIVMLIIFIVFAFSSMTLINTMGLLLFWGWLITVLGNLIFTIPMLAITNNK